MPAFSFKNFSRKLHQCIYKVSRVKIPLLLLSVYWQYHRLQRIPSLWSSSCCVCWCCHVRHQTCAVRHDGRRRAVPGGGSFRHCGSRRRRRPSCRWTSTISRYRRNRRTRRQCTVRLSSIPCFATETATPLQRDRAIDKLNGCIGKWQKLWWLISFINSVLLGDSKWNLTNSHWKLTNLCVKSRLCVR